MSTATSRNGTGDPCTRSSWDDPILAAGEHDDEEAAAAISTVGGSVWYLEENNGQPQQQQPKWELTWPIWHMLPRMERRALAQKHGYKTIGEFEEFMILQRAVGDSSSGDATYDNQHLYVPPTKEMDSKETAAIARTAASASLKSSPNEEFDNDDNSVDHDPDDNDDYIVSLENMALSSTSPSTLEELYERGGKILMLPDDLLHRICSYLPVDTYARLALVSPLWKSFTRTEATYKRLCERLYLNQCRQRRALHVSRFNHSYRTMLEKRPRVRAGGGVYVMKYARVRKIQRDMWTEIPAGAVLEMVYYRYLYFGDYGRVLYALTCTPPHEMFPRLARVCLLKNNTCSSSTNATIGSSSSIRGSGSTNAHTNSHKDAAAVWGQYTVHKTTVTVTAQQEWQHVQLTLTIDLDNRSHGRYGCLLFDHHVSSASGNFNNTTDTTTTNTGWGTPLSDCVVYDVPGEPFRFVKDKRL